MQVPRQAQQASNAWSVLFLLFLANMFNFFDRTIPAIIIEPLRMEWGLSDLQLGLAGTVFTIVYALAGIYLGHMADLGSRRKIMGWGLVVWSGFTALTGATWNFMSFLLVRMGVGVGEASYAPSANSLIGDLFPADKRATAMGIFMLGLPVGLLLAFFTVGAMVEYFDSWRAPFYIAAVPGFILAVFIYRIQEPKRGAAETAPVHDKPATNAKAASIRFLIKIPTFRWLILAGLAFNFSSYASNTFMVPMLQRYFHLPLQSAAMATGVIVGVTGLIGLSMGGWLADVAHRKWSTGRLLFGAISMLIAAVATGYALSAGRIEVSLFVAVFSVGWLFSYIFFPSAYTAMQDVIEPHMRGTAMAWFFACLYLFGGGMGPVAVGVLSDYFSNSAMLAAGASEMSELFKAEGLHKSMLLVPLGFFLTVVALVRAAQCFVQDSQAMQNRLASAHS